jgi:hypothetical protein
MKESQFEVYFPLSNPKLPIMSNHNFLKISKEVPFENLIFHACKKTQGFLGDLKILPLQNIKINLHNPMSFEDFVKNLIKWLNDICFLQYFHISCQTCLFKISNHFSLLLSSCLHIQTYASHNMAITYEMM